MCVEGVSEFWDEFGDDVFFDVVVCWGFGWFVGVLE